MFHGCQIKFDMLPSGGTVFKITARRRRVRFSRSARAARILNDWGVDIEVQCVLIGYNVSLNSSGSFTQSLGPIVSTVDVLIVLGTARVTVLCNNRPPTMINNHDISTPDAILLRLHRLLRWSSMIFRL